MTEKTFKIVNSDLSDGYHTFDELYDHRCLLWIALCTKSTYCEWGYWLENHFEGWDLIVVQHPKGQISYHVPVKYRYLYENKLLKQTEANHVYDGHTSADVLKRLEETLK